MASSAEQSGGGEKKGILNFLKKFNKISAAVLIGAGLVVGSELLIALGVIDLGQSWLWGKAEKWNKNRKAKEVGGTALVGATA